MTGAAARRSALGQVGHDLLARHGGPGQRRVAMLRRRMLDMPAAAPGFSELWTVPPWLTLPEAAQRRLGQRAMLAGMGTAIATSIDGEWLSGLAREAGDDALDWAIATADPARVLACVDGDALDGAGAALLRATLLAALQPLVDWARPTGDPAPAIARLCLDHALSAEVL